MRVDWLKKKLKLNLGGKCVEENCVQDLLRNLKPEENCVEVKIAFGKLRLEKHCVMLEDQEA